MGRAHIAIFSPTLHAGGAERFAVNIANGFVERGLQADVVLARAEGMFLSQLAPEVEVVDLRSSRVSRSIPALARYMRRRRPDAVLSLQGHANVAALIAKMISRTNHRAIVGVRNVGESGERRARDALVERLMQRYYPKADLIVCNSKGGAETVIETTGVDPSLVRVIHNPVVSQAVLAKAKHSPDHAWFAPGEPPVVLAVGRLVEQKDLPTLIKAFAAAKRPQGTKLLVLGEGPQRSQLEKLVESLDLTRHVAFPGTTDNPYAYMARAQTFVLSSRREGLPNVLIEALVCGPHLIATNCSTGPREILADGRYGTLIPVGDVERMAAAITKSLTSSRPVRTAEDWQRFELDRILDQYLQVLLHSHA